MADMTRVQVGVRSASVVTVPIDATLAISGQAADAKAVGDALDLKADRSELQTAINVNGETADDQGTILLDATEIPTEDGGSTSIAAALDALDAKTAADIPMSSALGAQSIAAYLDDLDSETQDMIFPIGSIYMSINATAPSFGTWAEILLTSTWNDLRNGMRGYTQAASTNTVHFWLRTA